MPSGLACSCGSAFSPVGALLCRALLSSAFLARFAASALFLPCSLRCGRGALPPLACRCVRGRFRRCRGCRCFSALGAVARARAFPALVASCSPSPCAAPVVSGASRPFFHRSKLNFRRSTRKKQAQRKTCIEGQRHFYRCAMRRLYFLLNWPHSQSSAQGQPHPQPTRRQGQPPAKHARPGCCPHKPAAAVSQRAATVFWVRPAPALPLPPPPARPFFLSLRARFFSAFSGSFPHFFWGFVSLFLLVVSAGFFILHWFSGS